MVDATKDVKKMEECIKKIQSAFSLADRDGKKTCDVKELGTVIRSLQFNPSEAQLHQIISECEEDSDLPKGFIGLEKFQAVMLPVMLDPGSHGMVRDTEETIYKAFKALDPENKGYIEADELRKALTSKGEMFSTEEINDLLTAATDMETGHIYYDDYAEILAEDE
uniref:EF-hand domain-containing protein n=1 Tax=Palpitomonas bilix TaxID=652834 RepID=A0A7S3DE38_9EUKA|mmetsp:Transcript_33798/g.86704  ORF Transcript_33798/g.86704 Transcript_33798/m.86704 type:complete len:166 (+) Transcript_33798:348-845(+)